MAKSAQNLKRLHTLIATFALDGDAKGQPDTWKIFIPLPRFLETHALNVLNTAIYLRRHCYLIIAVGKLYYQQTLYMCAVH